jgi:hypothetical protein
VCTDPGAWGEVDSHFLCARALSSTPGAGQRDELQEEVKALQMRVADLKAEEAALEGGRPQCLPRVRIWRPRVKLTSSSPRPNIPCAAAVKQESARLAAERLQKQQSPEEMPQRPPSQPSRSEGPGEGEEGAWLVVGIPSFARPNHVDYLEQSLDSILGQMPSDHRDPFSSRIKVLVMNNYGPGHKAFHRSRDKHAGSPYVEFLTNDARLPDPMGDLRDAGSPNKPGFKVRKQTRDLVALLRAARGRGHYYLFLEDDMLLCPHGLLAIRYMISKAEIYHPDWISLRASFGMNGIFLHDHDVGPFADYLLEHQARRPPDHLVVEWFAGEKDQSARYRAARQHVSFRYNLFHHIGSISSLRSEKQVAFPECYEPLGEPVLFSVEAFKPAECPNDDIWPCRPPPGFDQPLISWGAMWTKAKDKR